MFYFFLSGLISYRNPESQIQHYFPFSVYMCNACRHTYRCTCTCTTEYMFITGDNLLESLLSFHYMSLRHQTQAVKLSDRHIICWGIHLVPSCCSFLETALIFTFLVISNNIQMLNKIFRLIKIGKSVLCLLHKPLLFA